MSLLLSPHDDDSALFAAFTCLRERPTVLVVTDSYVQPARGETGCSAEVRAAETAAAHQVLGCPVARVGLRDDMLTLEGVIEALTPWVASMQNEDLVYTPALEGGNTQHDLVTVAAAHVFGLHRLRCYSTYAKLSQYRSADLEPVGTTEIEWTRPEYEAKQRALACYASQILVNRQHFDAVTGRSEWLSGYRRVQLGCGAHPRQGWLNIDRHPVSHDTFTDFQRLDLAADPLPVPDASVDYIFSEDVLEHLPPDRRVFVLNEMWRVLVSGGVMEHYVPNAGSKNDYGSLSHLSHWNAQCFDHIDIASHRWHRDRSFEGFTGGFTKIRADLLNWLTEDDGMRRAQSLRVQYRAVKPC